MTRKGKRTQEEAGAAAHGPTAQEQVTACLKGCVPTQALLTYARQALQKLRAVNGLQRCIYTVTQKESVVCTVTAEGMTGRAKRTRPIKIIYFCIAQFGSSTLPTLLSTNSAWCSLTHVWPFSAWYYTFIDAVHGPKRRAPRHHKTKTTDDDAKRHPFNFRMIRRINHRSIRVFWASDLHTTTIITRVGRKNHALL